MRSSFVYSKLFLPLFLIMRGLEALLQKLALCGLAIIPFSNSRNH